MKIFNETIVQLNKKTTLNFINIESYSLELFSLINNEIAKIWDGDLDDNDLETVKLEFKEWLNKKKPFQKYGFISEFICHLYLRHMKYEQHFLFRNLEEKGPKKGFDGIFVNNSDFWIYESKSTLPKTKVFDHNSNISEAYNDIKKKVIGENNKNNPWKNAYTHSNNFSIKRNQTLVDALRDLSKRYVRNDYDIIDKFNVIPSSIIYMDDKWDIINNDELKKKLKNLLKNYTAKKINVICMNKKSIDDFIKFIEN